MAVKLDIAKMTSLSEELVKALNSIPESLADVLDHLVKIRDENDHLNTAYSVCAECETAYNTDVLPKSQIAFEMLSESLPQLASVYANLNVNKRKAGNTNVGSIDTIDVPDLSQFGA